MNRSGFGEPGRAGDGVDVRARPAPGVRAVHAEAGVGRRRRHGGVRQLAERREHLVGHRRRAGVDQQHALAADRRRDVDAVGYQHEDVALHRQHVHLAVPGTLRGDRLLDRDSRLGRRHAQRASRRRIRERRPVFGVERRHAAARGCFGHPRLLLQPVGERRVLAGQEVRHPVPIGSTVLGERRRAARLGLRGPGQVGDVSRGVHIRLVHVDGVVHDARDRQDVVVAGDELRHGVEVARLRPAALEIAVLEVRGHDLQACCRPTGRWRTRSRCAARRRAGAAGRP